jgi:hypothetical protein
MATKAKRKWIGWCWDTGKVRFATKKQAKGEVRKMGLLASHAVYWCPGCASFHITHGKWFTVPKLVEIRKQKHAALRVENILRQIRKEKVR